MELTGITLWGLVAWCTLTLAIVVLALYRKFVSRNEDDTVHLADGEAPLISEQAVLARRLNTIDNVAKALTVADLLLGLGLVGWVLYGALKQSGFF